MSLAEKSFTYYTPKLAVPQGMKAYTELRQQVVAAGILERSYTYYTFLILFSLIGYFLSMVGLYFSATPLQLIIFVALFALFTVQLAGLIHDAGHRAIMKSTKTNDFIGYFIGSIVAASYDNWVSRHNNHHAHPNEEHDSQLDVPILAFTEQRFLGKSGFERLLAKYQVYAYFPLLSLGSFAQRIGDLLYETKQEFGFQSALKMSLLSIGFFIWFILPFLLLPLAKALVIFFTVHLVAGFYMTNIFAPNHKGMPQIKKSSKLSFLEQQIVTSRNIVSSWFYDFIYVGVNYQIEHHLFPNCPRNKLYLITPFVLQICRKYNLSYTSVGIIETNQIILSELKRIAKTVE